MRDCLNERNRRNTHPSFYNKLTKYDTGLTTTNITSVNQYTLSMTGVLPLYALYVGITLEIG